VKTKPSRVRPPLERRSKLLTIYPEPAYPAQDCGGCANLPNCYAPGIKEEHIITNLLVCRIKRGIEVNRSAKLFLQMVRPILKKFAKRAIAGTNIDIETALADLESQTIEYLQHYYVMGEIAYPLHYLFGQPNGVIRHFSNNYARKTRRYEETHVLSDTSEPEAGSAWEAQQPSPDEQEELETEVTRAARAVIDDGMTLTLPEYRVLKFCLTNAMEAKRPLNGLHVYLARNMGVVRARVTRIFADAGKKLVAETQNSR